MAEYQLETEPSAGHPNTEMVAYIMERSRSLAIKRRDVEESIRERMARGVPPITFYE